jgi:hypothetical protein
VSNLFAAGHRIRLDIGGTDFPRLEPNAHTGAAAGAWTTTAKARNSVYFGGRRVSYLLLPLLGGQGRNRDAGMDVGPKN